MADEFYHEGRKEISEAIALDSKGYKMQALSCYERGCRYLLAGTKLDQDVKRWRQVVTSLQDYVSRAEMLASGLKNNGINRNATIQEKNLKQIAGLEHVKQILREAILLPQAHPQLYTKTRTPWNGILLYGPPGTGKSHCVQALAADANCNFVALSSSDIISKHQGDSEKAIRNIFEQARASRPCVLFFDEIDSIGSERSDNEFSRRLLNELLKQMDGVGSDNDGITVIGATNHPQLIDSALRRRLQMRVYVPLPGPKARAKILRMHLGSDRNTVAVTNKEIKQLAGSATYYSGSDLASVANEALMAPVRRCLRSEYFRVVYEASGEPVYADSWTMQRLFLRVSNALGYNSIVVPDGCVIVPCSSDDVGAHRINMLAENFPCAKLATPVATVCDMREAFHKIRPTVNEAMLAEYETFGESFGYKNTVIEEDDEDSLPDDPVPVPQKQQSVQQQVRSKQKAPVQAHRSASQRQPVLS